MSIKVCVVLGTRPEAIKLAPVVQAIKRHPDIKPLIVSTGQHKEMLDQVLKVFDIEVDYDLQLMVANQTLPDLTAKTLQALNPIFTNEKPEVILTQGDTTTAFAASLMGFYHKIRIAHVEAGLRSHQKLSPFPEEINRKMISVLCDWAFVPTEESYQNLVRENIPSPMIHLVGNTVVDALQFITNRTPSATESKTCWQAEPINKKLILMTAHRRENFGDGFINICQALRHIATENEDVHILYPVHMNPNVREPAYRILEDHPNISLVPPMNYVDFLQVLKSAHFVLTDSGGVQEEAPVLGKPVLVLREVTERPEGINAGVAKLVGTDKEKIIFEANRLLSDRDHYNSMSKASSLYGDGKASARIVNVLAAHFNLSSIREEELVFNAN
jgi:UDP-N-acetylglucosamine 2-epimerase (non-hydrolysing)